nr:hypothetical protein CFP56_25917 [Quercus suber]
MDFLGGGNGPIGLTTPEVSIPPRPIFATASIGERHRNSVGSPFKEQWRDPSTVYRTGALKLRRARVSLWIES